jgi:hypothetical protein
MLEFLSRGVADIMRKMAPPARKPQGRPKGSDSTLLQCSLLPAGAALPDMLGCSLFAPDSVQNGEGPQASNSAHSLVVEEGQNSTVEQGRDTEAGWAGMGHWKAEEMVDVPRAVGRISTDTV